MFLVEPYLIILVFCWFAVSLLILCSVDDIAVMMEFYKEDPSNPLAYLEEREWFHFLEGVS